jgi:Cys-rich repeat protein
VRLSSLALLLFSGCGGNPVVNCPDAPRSDCCTENVQCLDYYGNEFPFCSEPERDGGGICSECARNSDCPSGESCDIGRDGFGVCLAKD